MKKGSSIALAVLLIIILLVASAGIFLYRFRAPNEEPSDPTEPSESPNVETSTQNQPTLAPTVDPSSDEAADRLAEIDAILNDPYMVLVNVDNGLTSEYEPAELETLQGMKLEKTTAQQLEKMLAAAEDAGLDTINIYSAYRNYTKQETNFNNKVNFYLGEGYSKDRANELAAEIVNPP